jgi:HSP20 family molecular chaperone IbpA
MNNDEAMTRRDDARGSNGRQHLRPIAPPCDVYESADEYLIVADVPGVDDRSIDIKLDRSKLTIEAHRTNGASGQVLDSEPQPKLYLRTFQVPETVDAAQIKAELRHGVLHLHLPKGPSARVRRIAVTAG